MYYAKLYGRLLLGTALALPIAMNAVAQNIKIDESELAGKSDACRSLAEMVQARTEPVSRDQAERVVLVINNDQSEECVALTTRLQQSDSTQDRVQAKEKLTQEIEVSEQVKVEGDATVTVPKPNVDVVVPAPNVRVTEQHPQIDVEQDAMQVELRQGQPHIEVEVPKIIVRVEIPAPKLYVLRTDPQVRLVNTEPQVEVAQGEPVVTVTQGKPELSVDINLDKNTATDDGDKDQAVMSSETTDNTPLQVQKDVKITGSEPQVEIVMAEGKPEMTYTTEEPTLSYESEEPQVFVMMAEQPTIEVRQSGEAAVIVETQKEREQRYQQQTERSKSQNSMTKEPKASQSTTSLANASNTSADKREDKTGNQGMMTVSQLMGMEVVTADGEDLGSPEAFIEINGATYLVLASGGFLGIGEDQVPVPMFRVTARGQQLVLLSMTEEEIEAANDFDYNENLELPDNRQIKVAR